MATVSPRICILLTEGAFASTVMQAKDFFHMASLRLGKSRGQGLHPALEVLLVSPDGSPINSFSNVPISADSALCDAEVIILPAFSDHLEPLQQRYPEVLDWLRAQHARGCAICGEATGVYWMAAAGLLDGKPATTYWRYQQDFSERFPKVILNTEKHLTDADNLFCASGTSSSNDLYIHQVERLCGANVAQDVYRDAFYEVQRNYAPGRIGFGGQKMHQDVQILQIQQWLEDHLAAKFRFEDLAREHGMSIRNFMRRFQSVTGDKPLHYLQRLRIETAKHLLTHTSKSIKAISYEIGYDDASFFARLFRQHTCHSPNQYRQQCRQPH